MSQGLRLLVLGLLAISAPEARQPAAAWWAHVVALAGDDMKGRETGTPEHRKAAEYVAEHFRRAGLQPGGTKGFFQPVPFRSRRIVEAQSSLALVRPGGDVVPVELGTEATFSMRIEPAPSVEAPIVFAGYGLQIPEAKHDDLDGLDVKGKLVLLVTGGPSHIPGPLLAHYQSTRWEYLKKAGAIGVLAIQNPRGQDIPWERSMLSRFMPAVAIADPALDETLGQQVAVTINPARAETFFAGSGHTFADVLALSNAGKVLPRFAIPSRARVKVTIEAASLESDNVIAILPGTDPVLKHEYVAISAHLDHVGVGEPINGDSIYNGAMDNASGIATLIETAAAAAKQGGFKRSLVFAAVTAEEKGLLGSRYFANRPTLAGGRIVANLNTDMFLPLFPLRSLVVQGLEESDLAADLIRAARPLGIEVLSDPEPERNAFVRSDQYSFIKTGVPALSLKVGFTKDSAEHQMVRRWRSERYHAPSDDLAQPIDRQAAEDFGRVYLAVVAEVANRPTTPRWNDGSFFRRFAPAEDETPITCSECAAWNAPREPFEVFGNTWYVGPQGLSSLLVVTTDGLVVVDGGLPQSAASIVANIRKLGHDPAQVKYILTSHAHYDHAGGLRGLQRRTGATVVASAASARALALGHPTPDDPQFGGASRSQDFPAVTSGVRVVGDGEMLRVGDTVFTAHHTPGHTPGATSWTWQACKGERCLNMVYADSVSAVSNDTYRFTGGGGHAGIVESFRASIRKLGALPCDIVVSTHPFVAGLDEKLARRAASGVAPGAAGDPMVDPGACRALAARSLAALEDRVRRESHRR
ncbi:MAG: subclass B3 metallo-beta-lactamase [Acidobacteriota bacterium]